MATLRHTVATMIGIYDSGYGGLTTLRAIRAVLPHHDMVYLGDSGRAPYGTLPTDVLLDYAEQCVVRLREEGCSLIIVACHTVSCVALRHLQQHFVGKKNDRFRILGVTIPAAQAAVAMSRGHIGIIATRRTVASDTFPMEMAKLATHRITQQAAPLLAPIVEEGWEQTAVAKLAVARYVNQFADVDTLLLGCTHFPLLIDAFHAARLPGMQILDPATAVAEKLLDWLDRHAGFVAPGSGTLRVLCTGDPKTFAQCGRRFLGSALDPVQHVAEHDGRLAHRESPALPTGQVVRPKTC